MTDDPISLDGLVMNAAETAAGGVVNAETVFRFSETDEIVTATFSGGGIVAGSLVGRRDGACLHFRYAQLQADGRLDGGESHCEVARDDEGRVCILEHFEWESRPGGGTNLIRELDRD